MKKDSTDMELEKLQAEHDRLLNEMLMAGSPSFFSINGKCYPCDLNYQSKLKAINNQIEIAKEEKTMDFSLVRCT